MFCKTCQTHLPEDVLACSSCGTSVLEDERQQAPNSDTTLTPADIHYESDLPADEKDIASTITVSHQYTVPIVADVYHEEEVLSATEASSYDESRIPSNKDTHLDQAAATELPTLQNTPPVYDEQPFSEYVSAREQAVPVTQADIPVPQITQPPVHLPVAYPYQAPAPHKQRRTSFVLLTLALIGLGLILLIENGGVIFFVAAYQPAQVHTQATAQAHKLATAQVKATDISQLQATAQAQSNSENLKMRLAQAQTGDPNTLYTMATSGKPATNASSNTKSSSACKDSSGGTFHVLESEKNTFTTCYITSGSDFVFQVEMNINTGDDGGLCLRSNSNDNFGYLLRFDQTGDYDVFLQNSDKGQWLQSSSIAGFKTGYGQTNLITVIALGDNFYLYSNAQYIGHIKDNTYSVGFIELLASNIEAASTDVVYSNAEFWDLS